MSLLQHLLLYHFWHSTSYSKKGKEPDVGVFSFTITCCLNNIIIKDNINNYYFQCCISIVSSSIEEIN